MSAVPLARGAPSRRARRRAARLAAAPLLALLALPAAAVAQPHTNAYSYAFQYEDDDTRGEEVFFAGIAGSCFDFKSGSGAVSSVLAPCSIPNGSPFASGSAIASGAASFDPVTGTFRSGITFTANAFTLSQFYPVYDIDGNRVYTGQLRPDAVGVFAITDLHDQFLIAHAPGVAPATLDLFLDWNGTLTGLEPGTDLFSFVQNFVSFCTGPLGICNDLDPTNDDQVFSGFIQAHADGFLPTPPLQWSASAPPGAVVPSIVFEGLAEEVMNASGIGSHVTVDGRLTLKDIPIAALAGFDFDFTFGSWGQFQHPSTRANSCDPLVDPSCFEAPPADANGTFEADFLHSMTFAGFKAFDAAGNDVSQAITLRGGTGLTVGPGGAITGPNVVPEPATLALVAVGLAALGAGVRRRRE